MALRRVVLLAVAVGVVAAAAPALASAAPPAGVTAIAFDGRAELSWQPVVGASAYTVYRGLTPSTITTLVTPTGGVVTAGFADTGAVNGTTYYYVARAVIAGAESADSITVQATPTARSCSAGNPVVLENCYGGTTAWNTGTSVSLAGGGIEGFATASSVNRGAAFNVKLQTAVATTASIEIYRGGWYGGGGARLISVVRGIPVGPQPACTSTASTGLYDCSNWATSATITTSSSWPSGVYLLRLVRGDNGLDYEFPVVVRDDASHSQLLYGLPFTTYQAYNNYGGKSLYGYNSTGAETVANSARAVKVSFDRPYVQPRDTTIPNWYARADYPMISWLERSGYDVTYTGSDDLESAGALVKNHKSFVSGAHDEYYSAAMRSALVGARDAGTSLFVSGANAVFWKIRFENGGRTEVCYKTTESGAADPVSPTTLWRDPNGANQPENALLGQMYTGDQDSSFYPLVVSAAEGADRIWRYTGLDAQAPGTSTSIGTQLVGWEWDKRFANGFEPSGVKTLATSPVTGNILNAPTGGYIVGTTSSHMTRYVAASGALVFDTGTNHWGRGLALTAAGQGQPDVRIRQATTNVLADMGTTPATPAADITLDSSTAPHVVSTSPGDGGTAPTTTAVGATFSAAMNASTITATSFTLKRPDGTTVPATVAYDAGTLTATLTPSVSLVSGTAYTARIDATVTSATGTPLQSAASWTFTTAAFFVTSTTPADGAQSALQDTEVAATFSAAVATATLTTSTFWLTDSSGATVPAALTYDSATTTATLQPNAPLAPGALYSAHVAASVTATDGTPLPAAHTWSFRTNACPCSLFPSDPVPDLAHLSTANGRSGGPWSLELGVKIRVDQPTRLSAVRFYKDTLETGSHIARVWDAAGVQQAQVSFVGETASGWQRQTFPAPPLLVPGVVYTVSVNANANFGQTFGALAAQIDSGPLHSVADGQNGVFADAAGSFPTQSFNSSSYFVDAEVVPDGEFLPIAVASTAPAAANGISPDVHVRATFTRSVDPATLTASTFSITAPDSTTVPGTISYDDASLTARLLPSAPLALGATYTVHLTTGIKSTTGSPLSAPVTFSFTTAATAPAPLTVDSTLPTAGASDIGAAVHPRAHFSKPLDAFSLDAAAFTLTGPAGAVQAAVSYDAASQNATLVPQVPLTLGATYTAHLAAAVEATDGTRLDGSGYSWTFTVAATSPGAPTVTGTSPATGATSVALASSLSATFAISLDPTSINGTTFTANRTDGAGTVAGTVSYDSATKTARLVPSAPLAPSADYFARLDASVKAADGTPMGTAYGWSFSTTACPCAFYFDSDTPAYTGLSTINGDGQGSTTLELGVKIAVDEPMLMTAFRFYKSPGETGTHVGRLWTAGGIQLAQQTFSSETASGWQQQALTTPVELLPGAVYVVSVNANEYFVQTLDALQSSIIAGPLRTVPDGANAVYGSASGTFPNQTFRTSSYFIDLQTVVEGTPAAPTVTATVPLAGATAASPTSTVRATFSRPMLPTKLDALAFTLTRVSDSTNVSGTITYDDSTNTAILTPSTQLTIGEAYTARVSTAAKARDGVPLAAPVTWTFTVASPPTVTAKTPADGATGVARNATVQVTFSKPIDTTTLSGITLSGPSGAISTTASYNSATNTVTLTPTALLAVSTTYTANVATTVKAADGSAVASPVTWSFTTTADGTAPTATITSGPTGTVTTSAASFAFSANESGSTFECAVDGGPFAACSSPVSLSGLADGTHTFSVRATDPAGNTGAAVTRTWTIDTSAPGGDGNPPDEGGPTPLVTSGPTGYTSSTTATFVFSANEPATFTCTLGGDTGPCTSPKTYTGLTEGPKTFTITATDAAGNTSAPESHSWTIDLTAPATTASCNGAACSAGWYTTSPVNVTLAATDSASGVDHVLYSTDGSAPSLTYTGPIAVTATTTVRFAAVDHVGNVEATKSQLVQVDTTAPTAPTLAFSAFANASATSSTVYFRPGSAGGFTVAGSSIDAQSGVASYGYASLGSGWTGSGGVYTFTAAAADPVEPLNVTATNGAGLTSAATSFTVTPDSGAPSSTVQCNGAACSAGWYTSSPVSVTLAASDSASGVDHILYSTDGSAPSLTYSGAIAISATSTVRFAAVDKVGNVEAAKSQLVQVDTTAPTAPSLAFSAFTNASATGSTVYFRPGAAGGVTVAGSSTDAQSGVASYGYPALGSGWSGSGGVYSFTAAAVDPVEPLNVTATNGAGLTSTATPFTVTPDSTAPVSSALCNGAACSAGWYTSAPVSVSLAAADAGSGVAQIRYTTNGSDPSPVNGSTYAGAFAVGSTTTVKFRAYDNVGNEEAVGSLLVRVDTTAPSAPALTFTGFTNASATGSTVYVRSGVGGGFTVSGSSTDAESGVASYGYPSLGSGWTGTGGVYAFTPAAVDPVEPLDVTATNNAGLTSAAAPFTVTQDGTAPASTVQCGAEACSAGWYTTSPLSVSLAATDSGSGVDRILYSTDGSAPSLTYSGPIAVATTTTIKFAAVDKVGNVESTHTQLVQVDTTAPTAPALAFSGFSNASATGSTVYFRPGAAGGFTVAGSSTDADSGIASYAYPGLGSGWSGTGGAYSFTAAADDPVEPLNVTATNGAGLTSGATGFTVTPDASAPASTVVCNGGPCAAGWYSTSPVSVTLTASDAGSGLDRILYSTDGSAPSLTYSGAISLASTATVQFAAVDKVGNVEPTRSQLVQIDTAAPTAPTLAFSALTNASVTGSTVYFRPGAAGTFTATGSSTDAGSGVASYAYPSLGSGWSGGGGAYSFTAAAVDPAEPLNVTATDVAGNTSAATGFAVTADGSAPASTATCNGGPCSGGWYGASPVGVTLAATDLGSGVDRILYSTDGSAPSLTYSGAISVASTATVRFAAVDEVGNVEATRSQLVQIDTTAPSAPALTFSALTNASATGSTVYFRTGAAGGFTVAGSSVDGESGVASYAYPSLGSGWSGGGAYTFSAASVDPAEPLNVTATNNAGLTSDATGFTVTGDGTAPATTAACNGGACSSGWYSSSPVSVSLAATDSGSGVDRILYSTDGSAPSLTYSGALAVATTTTIKFAAVDKVGNVESTHTQLVQIDTVAPSSPALAFSGFTNASATGSTIYFRSGASGGFTVAGSSTDSGSGVASYAYPSLGSGWSGSGAYTFGSGAADPAEPLNVTATDVAGNTSAATGFTVTPDGSAPASTVACNGSACSSGWYSSSPVSVSLAATDSGSGLDRILYSTDGSAPSLTYSGALAVATTTTIKFTAVDKVGNVETTQSQLVQIDSSGPTPPALSFTAFTNAIASGSTVYFRPGADGGFTVTGSSTDSGSGIASYSYPSLGSGWSATGGAYSFTAAAVDPVEPLNVTATNNAGVTSTPTSFTVTPDASTPVTTIACGGGACSSGWYASSPVSVSLAATDSGSGVAQIRYTTDGTDPSPVNGTTYAGAFAVASTTTVKFRAYDNVGNEEAVGSQPILIDTTAPTAPALTFSGFDNASAAGSTVYFRPGAAGTFTATGSSTDSGSGVASYAYPSLGTGWSGTSGAYSFTAAAVDPAEPLNVTATDVAGNTSGTSGFTVTPDSTTPASTVVCGGEPCSAGWYGASPVSVSLAATDSGSGVDRILYSTDGSAPSLTYSGALAIATTTTVKFAAVDKVGNLESTHSQLVQIDTSAPSAPSLSFSAFTSASATGSTVYFRPGAAGGFTVGASSTDGESGVASYAYPSLGGGWSGSGGAYSFTASADDPAEPLNVTATNNAGVTSSATGFTVAPDSSAPASTVSCGGVACASGWYGTSPISVTLAATDTGSGVDRILYSTDGSAPSLTYSGALAVATTTTIKFAAVDKVGNVESTHTQLVQIDVTPPSAPALTFSAFTSASATGSTVYFRPGAAGGFTVGASSTDSQSGVASYGFPSLGSGWSGSGAYSFTAAAVDPAEPLNVTASDNAGNLSSATGFTVTSDGAAPVTAITCNGGSCSGGWYTSAPTISLAATDLGSGVSQIRYTTDGSDPSPLNGITYLSAFSVPGTATVKYRAYDNVGNEELVGSTLVRIDTTGPGTPALTLSESSPYEATTGSTLYYNPSGSNSGSFSVGATATDAESGIASIDFPTIAGLTGGGSDGADPFQGDYSWSAGASASGAKTVTASNGAGLQSSAAFTLTPDTQAPAGGSVSYADGFTTSGAVTITTADGTDAGAGLDAASRVLERQTAALTSGTCGTYGAWTAVISPDTVANATCARYRLRISDRVANEATYTSTAVVKVDTGAPSAPVLTLSESSQYEAITGSTLFYNPSGSNSGSFTVDATSSASSGITKIAFPALTGMTGGGDDTTSPYSGAYSWTSTATATGAKSVTATSGAGQTASSTFTVTPDTAAPTGQTAALVGGPWYTTTSISVTSGDGSDALAGLDTTTRLLERTTAPLAGGTCGTWSGTWTTVTSPDTGVTSGTCVKYRFSIADRVANRSTPVETAVAMVDTTPPAAPSLAFSGFSNASLTGSTVYFRTGAAGGFSVAVTASDPESGIAQTTLPALGSGWTLAGSAYTFTGAAVDPTEPNNVTARNGAGLTSAATAFTVTADGAGPSGGAVTYTDGYRTAASVALTLADGTDAGSGVDTATEQLQRAEATLSAGTCGAYGAYTTIATDPPLSTSDATVTSGHCYTYRYVVTDKVGNSSTFTSASVAKIDAIAPTATLADPGANLRGTVTLTSTTADAGGSGIATVTYQRSPAGANTWTTIPAAWDTTTVTDGLYDLRVVAADAAGNTTNSTVVAGRRVDNTLPNALLADPGANLRGTVTLSSTTSDSGSGVATVAYERSPAGANAWTATPASFDTTTVADGLYDLRVVVVDNAGNTATNVVAGRRVDNTAPSATINSPGATVFGTVTLTSSTSDDGSGVASVQYQRSPAAANTWTNISSTWDTATVADGNYDLRVVATDVAGNVANSAAVTTHVDNTTPRVTATTPVDGAGGVSVTANMTATFSRSMDAATITATSFTLAPAAGGANIAATVTYDGASKTATLDPTASLAGSTSYTAKLTTTVKASDGTPLAAQYTWTFSTGGTPPTVTSTSPANGATGVAVGSFVTATFSQAMDASTITGASFTLKDPGGNVVPATVTYDSATTTAKLTPSAALAGSTTYTARLETTIKSSAGLALSSPVSWTFTTASSAPTVVSVTPPDGMTGVDRTYDPTATFSVAMDASTITISSFTLKDPGGSTVGGTVSYNATTKTATYSPTKALNSLTTYTARLETTIKSSTGLPLAAAYSWRFQTVAPRVTATYPTNSGGSSGSSAATSVAGTDSIVTENGSTDAATTDGASTSTTGLAEISPWTPIEVTFSEPMDPATITSTSFQVLDSGGSPVATTIDYDPTTYTAVATPVGLLKYGATYTVNVANTIAAPDGAPLEAPVSWQFTTTLLGLPVGIDSGADKFSYWVAANNGLFLPDQYFTGGTARTSPNPIAGTPDPVVYQTTRDGVVTYSAKVPVGTYNMRLHFADTESTAVGQRVFSVDVVDTPTSPDVKDLDIYKLVGANTAYVVTIDNVTATPQTPVMGSVTVKTIAGVGTPTIAAVELVPLPPAITSVTPANGATNIARTSQVKIQFAQPMDAASITNASITLKAPNGSVVPASVAWNDTQKLATLSPSSSLAAATIYTVTVDGSVKAFTGLRMGTPYTSTFKTK